MNNFLAWEHQTSSNHQRLSICFGRNRPGVPQVLGSSSAPLPTREWSMSVITVKKSMNGRSLLAQPSIGCDMLWHLYDCNLSWTCSTKRALPFIWWYLVTFPAKIWIPTVRPLRFIIAQQSAESLLISPEVPTLAEGHADQHVVQSARDRP